MSNFYCKCSTCNIWDMLILKKNKKGLCIMHLPSTLMALLLRGWILEPNLSKHILGVPSRTRFLISGSIGQTCPKLSVPPPF